MTLMSSCRWDWASYDAAAIGKTSALMTLPVHGAALIGGRSAAQSKDLADCFRDLGLLFQMQDDVVDLFGDKGRGQRGNDLREGKVSALIVTHLERRPDDREALVELLKRDRDATRDEDVAAWSKRFTESGALDAACAWADELVEGLTRSAELAVEPGLRAMVTTCAKSIAGPIEGLRSA